MTANTLTDLIPDAYAALDMVSRELTGMIPAVTRDATVERAALGQTVRSHVAPAVSSTTITAGQLPPDDGEQTIGNENMTITKAKRVPFKVNGEENRGLNNGGAGTLSIQQNQIAQAFRTLTNEIEADLCALQSTFGTAYGAGGTTPFATASNYTDATRTRKLLKDAGAPQSDIQMVLGTAEGANFAGFQADANRQGDDRMLRQGVLLDINGMPLRESGQVVTHTAGTAASATTDAAGYAVGATTITLASAGTGTILAGDVIGFAGDDTKYVVATGDADVSNGGTVVLVEGLRKAIPASATAITVEADSTRNLCFSRSAIVLAARAPALPAQGDSASDRTMITDPHSGLSFELSMYKGYREVQFEVAMAWGVKNFKKEHTGLLLG